ncbi:DUF7446 family protein [Alteribacter populi]|uniref:DUF7446 family protein n=1 Tax=Alteribacter populi TaxID=2011011 RepID=UPI000BBA973B|nr:hypothetical protein [Alteribacter populi]
MKSIRIGVSPLTENVYAGEIINDMWVGDKQDVTEDFKRCVVNYCTKVVEFEVDGMKFKATCERV